MKFYIEFKFFWKTVQNGKWICEKHKIGKNMHLEKIDKKCEFCNQFDLEKLQKIGKIVKMSIFENYDNCW